MSTREKNSVCHKCKNFGHQKRNCPKNINTQSKGIVSSVVGYVSSFIYTDPHMKKIEEFILKCKKKSICLKFQHKEKISSIVGNFRKGKKKGKRKRIFTIDSIDGVQWGRWCKEEFPEIVYMDKITFDDLLTFIQNNKIFTKISCNMYTLKWTDILQELKKVGKIDYTSVAEDKRSGCNLIKYLKIDGHPVNHNAHADCMCPLEQGQFYHLICDLYDTHKAPSYAKESVIYFLGVRKELPFPKDIVFLIAKDLWNIKNDKVWCRKNVSQLMNNKQSISVFL